MRPHIRKRKFFFDEDFSALTFEDIALMAERVLKGHSTRDTHELLAYFALAVVRRK